MYRLFKTRDRDARARSFDAFVRPHLPALYQTAYRLMGSSTGAEDLLQDVLVKVYDRQHKTREITEPRGWLLQILRREFLDGQRRLTRRRETSIDAMPDPALDSPTLASSDEAPDVAFARGSLATDLNAAMQRLTPDQRALVTLHFLDGYTLEQLTKVFDAPLGTLKSRLHRTRAQLQSILGVEPFGLDDRYRDRSQRRE